MVHNADPASGFSIWTNNKILEKNMSQNTDRSTNDEMLQNSVWILSTITSCHNLFAFI